MLDEFNSPQGSPSSEPPLRADSDRIINHLGLTLEHLMQRMARWSAGELTIEDPTEVRLILEVVARLPELLALVPEPPPPPPPPPPPVPPYLIPDCPLCGAPPDTHWPRNCPIADSLPPAIQGRLRRQ